MINGAFERFDDLENLILHSDQGWQYQIRDDHQQLQDKNIIQSMSRKGNCLDNSPIESFWGILKSECLYNKNNKEKFKTRIAASNTIKEYIRFYNHSRITLKSTTPSQARYDALNKNIHL